MRRAHERGSLEPCRTGRCAHGRPIGLRGGATRRWRNSRGSARRGLVDGLLGDRVPVGEGDLIRRPKVVTVRPVAPRLVPVAVVEGQEDHALADAGDAGPRPYGPARRGHLVEVAFLDPEPPGVGVRELCPDLRGRLLGLRCAGRPGAGVELLDSPARRKEERVLLARVLVGWDVVACHDDRLPEQVQRAVLGLLQQGAS
jgi:hypothetical protein